MKHCCENMNTFITEGEVDIVYIPKFREYGISYLDGGTSIQTIIFCPWCGVRLPESLRNKWYDIIFDELELEPDDPNIPAEYLTDKWYSSGIGN